MSSRWTDDDADLRLEFEGGESVPVVLLEQDAPETCERVRAVLPLKSECVHSRWSGREVNIALAIDPSIPRENQTAQVSHGDVVYWRDWELPAADAPEALAVYYGPEVTRGPQGPLRVNPIGRVPQREWGTLETIGTRIWRNGSERLEVREND